MCNPIVDWTDRDVWDYLTEQKTEYNPLYCEGFNRVGCVGCPLAGKKRYEEFAKYPKYRQMYINAFERMLERRKANGKDDSTGRWATSMDVFHWWMEDGVVPGQVGIEDLEADMEEML